MDVEEHGEFALERVLAHEYESSDELKEVEAFLLVDLLPESAPDGHFEVAVAAAVEELWHVLFVDLELHEPLR